VTVVILDLVRSRLSLDLEECWSRGQLNRGRILVDFRSWGLEEWMGCRGHDRRREET